MKEHLKKDPVLGILKLCLGPLHPPNGDWFPVETNFWRVGSPARGTLYRAKCKKCEQHLRRRYNKNPRRKSLTYVDVSKYWWMVEELFERLGVHETCRRLEISVATFYNHRTKKFPLIRRTTVQKAVQELALLRAEEQKGLSPAEAYKARKALQVQRWRSTYVSGEQGPASATL